MRIGLLKKDLAPYDLKPGEQLQGVVLYASERDGSSYAFVQVHPSSDGPPRYCELQQFEHGRAFVDQRGDMPKFALRRDAINSLEPGQRVLVVSSQRVISNHKETRDQIETLREQTRERERLERQKRREQERSLNKGRGRGGPDFSR